MATKVIGLDFGSRSIKLCESSATLRTTELIGYDAQLLGIRQTNVHLEVLAKPLIGFWSDEVYWRKQSFVRLILYRIVCRIRLSVRLNQIESILAFELDDRILSTLRGRL